MKNTVCTEKAKAGKLVASLQPILRKAVRTACRKYLPQADETVIEDFCEEINVRLIEDDYRRLLSFAEESSLETWLYQVARNLVVNSVKRHKPTNSLDEHETSEFQVPAPQEKEVLLHEWQELVEWALQELTARDRELYDLFFRQELKPAEISQRTGITLAQVPKRKNKLVRKLAKVIERLIEGEGG